MGVPEEVPSTAPPTMFMTDFPAANQSLYFGSPLTWSHVTSDWELTDGYQAYNTWQWACSCGLHIFTLSKQKVRSPHNLMNYPVLGLCHKTIPEHVEVNVCHKYV